MQELIFLVLYIVVITGMVMSAICYYKKEVIFTTRIMLHTSRKVIKGEAAQKFGLYSFIGYLIIFLTLLTYSTFGTQLGYIGVPFCISGFIPIFLAFYVIRNDL